MTSGSGNVPYRYGFNGMEKDDELKGEGNSYDFGARMLDTRLGRWFSADKMFSFAPGWTPYRAFYDNPIFWTDKDGNIEIPLKATQIFGPTLIRVESDFLVRIKKGVYEERDKFHLGRNRDIGHKAQDYTFAYRSIGEPKKTEAQVKAQSEGMLAIIVSGFFKERREGTSPHIGTDLRAPIGTDVYSFGDGTVTKVDYSDGTGNFIVIQYLNGDKVRFMHLSESFVKEGDQVYEGQVFAKSGNSGYQSPGVHYAPHLHVDGANLEGQMINPLERTYGSVSNEEFFGTYEGDYKKLHAAKVHQIEEVVITPQGPATKQQSDNAQIRRYAPYASGE